VSFADDAARERWSDPVKAAFRLLADSGFGGERSRGWGRSEAPEFVEGSLPDMMLGTGGPLSRAPKKRREKPAKAAETQGPEAGVGGQGPGAGDEPSPVAPVEPPTEEPPVPPVEEPPVEEPPLSEPPAEAPPVQEPPVEEPPAEEPEPLEEASQREKPDVAGFSMSPDEDTPEPPAEPALSDVPVEAVPEPVAAEPAEATPPAPSPHPPAPEPAPERARGGQAYWLLSLYTPSADDTVDWSRGSYSLVHRAGRVDTSGDLKKHISMVTEGSVVVASQPPRGAAPDVAPEGCAHPVFRAGFAVAIPIGEAS